ncbi:MAG: PaaI family thioesterase [Pseudomonadota bacterium]
MTKATHPILDIPALHDFLQRAFPQVAADFEVLDVAPSHLSLRLVPGEQHLRPGGTVSGPSLFAMADCAVYLAIIAHVGEEALAVTTNASMDFMRRPAADKDLRADVTLLKMGRSLVVGDVAIRNANEDALVARATLTYSRPPS